MRSALSRFSLLVRHDDFLDEGVARSLLDLVTRFGEHPSPASGIRIMLNLSQQELGDLVGATRESINKHLGDWARQGFLEVQGGRLTISDIDSVCRIARVADE